MTDYRKEFMENVEDFNSFMKDLYVFFWGGPLSNWYPAPIKCSFFPIKSEQDMSLESWDLPEVVKYSCVEQYMMAAKAKLFNDEETFEKIMKTNEPREQKALGRQVKNFIPEEWDAISYRVVKYACLHKFCGNKELGDYLLSTEGKHLVEASPHDRIWGIGYTEKDALSNINDWGENRLGNILMEVREELPSMKDILRLLKEDEVRDDRH